MPDKAVAVKAAIEAAEVDALAMASLLATVEVLLKEAMSQDNAPRVERLLRIADIAEAARRRAIARKAGL